jgi:hypothetical protein
MLWTKPDGMRQRTQRPLGLSKRLPVLSVVGLDELKGPRAVHDVATDQHTLGLVSEVTVPGQPQLRQGILAA